MDYCLNFFLYFLYLYSFQVLAISHCLLSKPYSGKLSYKRFPSILDNVYFRFHRWTDESIIHAQLRLIFVSKHICISLLWKHAYMLSSAIIKMFLNFDVSCILHKLVVVVLLRAIFKIQLRNFGISVDYPCNWVVINVWRCVTLLRQVQP